MYLIKQGQFAILPQTLCVYILPYQKAVAVYFTSQQILFFCFAEPHSLHRDLFLVGLTSGQYKNAYIQM